MEEYLKGLVASAVGGIKTLANTALSRITTVWTTIITFFRSVGAVETTLRARVTSWVQTQIRHAQAVLTTLKWIATTLVPRLITIAVTQIRTWTSALITAAKAELTKLVTDLRTWATKEIASLLAGLAALRTWALNQFAPLINLVNKIAASVFGVLSTPERIANWIVAAMFTALMKYIEANLEAIADYIWARRVFIWQKSTAVLEDILTRLL